MNEQDFMLCQVFGATDEIKRLEERLNAAREVIEMLNAAVSHDEIEAAKSAAYEWLKCS